MNVAPPADQPTFSSAPALGELASFFERTDRITTVRAGMEQTLKNVKAAAEFTS
ncbi:MAG: hypothetical protein ACRD29_00915 [Acidimicrobiales bacterium]